jgi:hypothetical protein
MIYGASAGAVFIGGEPRRRMESDLPGCTQCGGASMNILMFRCGPGHARGKHDTAGPWCGGEPWP